MKTTPSRQFDFGLGGIANCWAKAGCFIGGLKAPQVDAGPILFAATSGGKAGDFQRRIFTAKIAKNAKESEEGFIGRCGEKSSQCERTRKKIFSGGHGVSK